MSEHLSMDEFEVGQAVTFVFETKTRTGGRISKYATGTIEKVGERLSIRITDQNNEKNRYWREQWVGKLKVVHRDRIIPDLPEGDTPDTGEQGCPGACQARLDGEGDDDP